MLIGELEEIIKRSETYPNIRFIASRWGERQGAPENTLTVLVGDWTITEKYGKPHLSKEHISHYNVPYPFVPRDTICDRNGVPIKRGYVGLLIEMLKDRVIRPTKEVRRALGDEWPKVRKMLNLGEV